MGSVLPLLAKLLQSQPGLVSSVVPGLLRSLSDQVAKDPSQMAKMLRAVGQPWADQAATFLEAHPQLATIVPQLVNVVAEDVQQHPELVASVVSAFAGH